MRFSTIYSASFLLASVASAQSCTGIDRREALREIVESIISGTDEDIKKPSFTNNVTVFVQVQGARFITGKGVEGARNSIRLGHAIATDFGPAPEDLNSYLDNGVNQAFVNGTATVGLHTPDGGSLGLVVVPAQLSSTHDTTCEIYEAVAAVQPIDGVIKTALTALLLQNFPLYEILDVVDEF
ncbi:hypothetical protein M409DRAFT_51627 [Zasmidium cellare ATCC 36951]|uniref:Uncharacterized protein n=1 Tax=Zasmidium cellare ATCC 36951 TaxID=1080233 RepID=A0A6A6CXU1_ZASCE|nr:uncharacterized protein M409DRAFT_51627 [Zasmidium cellare ATCC 36951]KAF2170619.1 hypothetical protein M409DRAFT_51627 [Zasmidium cellare ATCC 36951]